MNTDTESTIEIQLIDEDTLMPNRQKKSSKGKTRIGWIGMTFILLFIIVGVLFFFKGNMLISMGNNLIAEVKNIKIEDIMSTQEKATEQKVEKEKAIELTVLLEEHYELLYKNLPLCTPKDKSTDSTFKRIKVGNLPINTNCSKGKCSVSIEIKDPKEYPKSILAYVTDEGECKQRSISMKIRPRVKYYEGVIKITPEWLKSLGIVGNDYNVSVLNTNNSKVSQFMGTKEVSFFYDKKVNVDTLMINGIKKANIIYTDIKAVEKIIAKPDFKPKKLSPKEEHKALLAKQKSIETELKQLEAEAEQGLKEERKALLKELKALKGK
ncbi:MAG: hypothetical protein Q9M36_14620 [Sulfurovum sp.]|nr:hypothetical protein [Sulfurovum sp.]